MKTNPNNAVTVIGALGQDVSQKEFSSGKKMASFSLAYNERFKKETGEEVKTTDWFNFIAWNDLAEEASAFKKGDILKVEGKLRTNQWVDSHGQKRTDTEIVAQTILKIEKQALPF